MASQPSSSPANSALTPVPAGNRVFHFHEHAALWFSLGTGLLVMQIGAYLVPAVGTRDAVIAILLGSLIGAGLLAWTARLGCQTGLSSAGLMHATYGSAFARLPVLLNIAQLLGWTTFELVIMQEGTVAIATQTLGIAVDGFTGKLLATLLWGAVLTALMAGSMLTLVRRFVSRFALPLVIASLAWLTWQFGTRLMAQGFDGFWNRPGAGGMGMFSAMDLVIAMPVSWLPLVADYARHGKSGGAALRGTWLGYALANMWCYSLGVLVALTLPSTDLVQALLLAQGGLIALSLILIDEVDNAYGDTYSGAVSAHSLLPRWGVRRWGIAMAAVCTALALVLPMHSNHHGQLFAGQGLQWLAKAAFLTARGLAQREVVMAGVTRVDFLAPVPVGCQLTLRGWVSRVGRSSMTVCIHGLAVRPHMPGEDVLKGVFEMVAVDATGRPVALSTSHLNQETTP